jgi:hypothetical protein
VGLEFDSSCRIPDQIHALVTVFFLQDFAVALVNRFLAKYPSLGSGVEDLSRLDSEAEDVSRLDFVVSVIQEAGLWERRGAIDIPGQYHPPYSAVSKKVDSLLLLCSESKTVKTHSQEN